MRNQRCCQAKMSTSNVQILDKFYQGTHFGHPTTCSLILYLGGSFGSQGIIFVLIFPQFPSLPSRAVASRALLHYGTSKLGCGVVQPSPTAPAAPAPPMFFPRLDTLPIPSSTRRSGLPNCQKSALSNAVLPSRAASTLLMKIMPRYGYSPG